MIKQKKLNSMSLPKLRTRLLTMEKKRAKCKVNSRPWILCEIDIDQTKREIDFKELIAAGLKVMMRD